MANTNYIDGWLQRATEHALPIREDYDFAIIAWPSAEPEGECRFITSSKRWEELCLSRAKAFKVGNGRTIP